MSQTKWYVAARHKETARELADQLVAAGDQVVSRWIYQDDFGQPKTDDRKRQITMEDEQDILRADALVMLSNREEQNLGGRHVEFGMFLQARKPVFVVGPRENVFHWHPAVTVIADQPAFLRQVQIMQAARRQKAIELAMRADVAPLKSALDRLHRRPLKVAVIGAPSTGKTTLLRELCNRLTGQGKTVEIIEEYARSYIQRFGVIRDPWEQLLVFDEQARREQDVTRQPGLDLALCDTALWGGYVYTRMLVDANDRRHRKCLRLLERWVNERGHQYDATLYLPICWQGYHNDGVRNAHAQVRADIDRRLRGYMDMHDILYVALDDARLDVRVDMAIQAISGLRPKK